MLTPPDVFASTWESRPSEPVLLGLRLISARDRIDIRRRAKEYADGDATESGNWLECYNLALMRLYVARGLCDPNDVNKASDILQAPDHQVWYALTELGTRWLFEELVKNEIKRSPQHLPIEADDLLELVERIGAGEIAELPTGPQEEARRYLNETLSILRTS